MLKPLLKEMAKDIIEGKSVNADETPIPVQAPGKTHQGYIWCYIGKKAVVYQYGETRAYKNAEEFLKNFEGYIQADAYGAYDALCDGEKRIKLGCWAHCRRKFNDVLINQPNHRIAKEMIDRIGKLYQIERDLLNVTEQERVKERRARAGPILEKMYTWLKSKNVLPKSRLGKAIQYTFNQWESLTKYLDVGFMGIDNNISERAMRPITLGRKNYLFCGSHRAAENAAVLYSLIETCKRHNVNTVYYLQDILERLPTTLNADIRTLLPYNWEPQIEAVEKAVTESAA